jgi:hypothetical protein
MKVIGPLSDIKLFFKWVKVYPIVIRVSIIDSAVMKAVEALRFG